MDDYHIPKVICKIEFAFGLPKRISDLVGDGLHGLAVALREVTELHDDRADSFAEAELEVDQEVGGALLDCGHVEREFHGGGPDWVGTPSDVDAGLGHLLDDGSDDEIKVGMYLHRVHGVDILELNGGDIVDLYDPFLHYRALSGRCFFD